ncbi:MAG: thermonuclease family protein [Haloferacaceae archaeon]
MEGAPTLVAAVTVVALVGLAGCAGGLGPVPGAGTAEPTAVPGTGTPHPATAPTVRATVVEVIDGDTVRVRYRNGTTETVRLLGVDAPEVRAENDPGEFEGVPDTEAGRRCLRRAGEAASAAARSRLAGETVGLGFDPEADRRGGYGRLLAYVYVGNGTFNHRLLVAGHARLYESPFVERSRYAAAEARARAADRGVWACATGD